MSFLVLATTAFVHRKHGVFYARPFFQSTLLLLYQLWNVYHCFWSELERTCNPCVANELPQMKSSTLIVGTMLFNVLRVYEYDLRVKSVLLEARAKAWNVLLVSRVSHPLFFYNAEKSGGTKNKNVRTSKTPSVLGKCSLTPNIIGVNIQTPVEPRKLCKKTNHPRVEQVRLIAQQKSYCRILRTTSRRLQWYRRRWRRSIQTMVGLTWCIVSLQEPI